MRFRPAPLGACVCINFRAHTSAAAQNQECLGAVPAGPTGGLRMHKFQGSHFSCRASVCRANLPSSGATAPRTAGWDTQAQKRDRTAEIFLSLRARWPGKNLD